MFDDMTIKAWLVMVTGVVITLAIGYGIMYGFAYLLSNGMI